MHIKGMSLADRRSTVVGRMRFPVRDLRTGRNQGCSDAQDGVHSIPRRKGTSRRLGRFRRKANSAGKEVRMWKKPTIVEIAVGLEINSYACAELD